MPVQDFLADFKRQFPDKYSFVSDDPMGAGHFAAVFQAKDTVRDLDVGIKIYHTGIAPNGSKRGWWITSQLSHQQIATTFTVEDFSAGDGTLCKAVISKFIPGRSLKSVWASLNDLPEEERRLVADDFALSLVPSILGILDELHKAGYGHGDCHDGNIMTVPVELGTNNQFLAVLIDFDNASMKEMLAAQTEKEKMAEDYSLLRRTLNFTLMDWEWHKLILPLHGGYNSVPAFKIAYEMMLSFLAMARKKELTPFTLQKFFAGLVNFGQFSVPPIIDAIRNIAHAHDCAQVFEDALKDFNAKMKKSENWDAEVTMEVFNDVETKLSAYRKIFGA